MGPRLSGLTSIFGVVFFVSKSPLSWFSDVRGRSRPLRFPSLPLPSDILCARSCSWRQSTHCMARANHNARKKWSVEKSTNQFRIDVFFLDQIFGKWRFLSYVSILCPKNAVLSQTNSGSVLVLRWISRIAVSGRSLWDLRGTHYKILSCEYILQTSNEDLQYVCKKVLPKAEKDWKKMSNLKVLRTSWGRKYLKTPRFAYSDDWVARDQTHYYPSRDRSKRSRRRKFYFLQVHLKIKQGFLYQ